MARTRPSLRGALATATNALTGTPAALRLDRLLRDAVAARPTPTSRAMDDAFIRTGIGGSHHRVFDDGHDAAGAFAAAKGAHPDAGFAALIGETVRELWKDMATPRGIPLVTLDKASFEQVAAFARENLGMSRERLLDMATMTATELGGVVAAAAAFAMGRMATDADSYFRMCGSLGLSAAVAANPLLVASVVVALLYAARRGRLGWRAAASIATGFLIAGTLLAAGTLLGPFGFAAAGILLLAFVVRRRITARRRTRDALAAYRRAIERFARLPAPREPARLTPS